MPGRRDIADDKDEDAEWLRRAAAGDADASRRLVERHLGPIVGLAGRMLGRLAEAEEVAQETFLRAWQIAATWRPGEARFATWLYRVALNLCHDRLRRRRESPLDAAGRVASADPLPDADAQRAEVARRVAAALDRLPERQRAAIVLCHYQGLGNAAAAEVMGIGVEALESLLARGRRALRTLLAGEARDLLGEP